LGFLVSARGIEANPEKIQAIITMGKPAKLHDIQKLAGRVAVMTHKYRGSQQSLREILPKFIDSTQGEPKNICKP
jgi:hypothetical protein